MATGDRNPIYQLLRYFVKFSVYVTVVVVATATGY